MYLQKKVGFMKVRKVQTMYVIFSVDSVTVNTFSI